MSNTETQPFLIDAEAAKALYKDLRDRVNQIPPPIDPSVVIDDASKSATDKTWSAAKIVKEQNKKAPIIIDSKSGNPIVIDDGIPGLKLYDMKVSFAPKQAGSGDPSPTNIRPLSGRTGVSINRAGKNVFDREYLSDPASYKNEASGYMYTDAIRLVPNTTYTITPSSTEQLETANYYVLYINPSETDPDYLVITNSDVCYPVTAGKPKSITFTTGATGIVRFGTFTNSLSAFVSIDWQLELGATATAYEPYSGTTIPVSWQTEAGEVYGGTLDVLTGVLTVEWASKTIRWGDVTKNPPGEFMTTGYIALDYETKLAGESGVSNEHKCNAAVWIWSGEANTTPHFYVYRGSSGKCTVLVVLPNGTDEDLNIVVVSKLKEPYAVQLDPVTLSMLIGENVIWTDANTAEIAYPVDTKKYVDAGARDVQIAGTSILQNGVANVPPAGGNDYGVVKVNSSSGRGIELDSSGFLQVSYASSGYIKAGSDARRAVVPYLQHESAFYGLAKVAGVDLAGQTVTLGQYPNSAKAAITQMLGIGQLYGPMEEIVRTTIAEDSAEITINVDKYGLPFKLANAQIILIYGTVASGINNYIRADVLDPSGLRRPLPTLRIIPTSWTWFVYNFIQFGGHGIGFGKVTSTGNSQTPQESTYSVSNNGTAESISVPYITGAKFSRYDSEDAPIPAGSQIIISGCRVIE